jgi:hypothetical protein
LDVVGESFWQVNMVDIAVDGLRLNLCSKASCSAVLDTGSSYILGPSDDLNILESVLDVSCSRLRSGHLPIITFILSDLYGTYEFDVHPTEYIATDLRSCVTKLTALDFHEKQWILGDEFLNKYVSKFRLPVAGSSPRVGLALAVRNTIATQIVQDMDALLEDMRLEGERAEHEMQWLRDQFISVENSLWQDFRDLFNWL